MRLVVSSAGKRVFKLVLPTGFFTSRLGAGIARKFLMKNVTASNLKEKSAGEINVAVSADFQNITRKQLVNFFREVKKFKKHRRIFKIFEAIDAEGDGVEIYL